MNGAFERFATTRAIRSHTPSQDARALSKPLDGWLEFQNECK